MVDFLIPSWEEIEDRVFQIVEKMTKDGFFPDAIIAVLTGGAIPAKLLSDILDTKNIKYVDIKFYKGVGTTENRPVIKAIYINDLENKNVLIVDDVSDTGETLEAVSNVVSMFSPKTIRTAALYVKPWSRKIPDYYGEQVGKWIVFPWDKWDVVRSNPEVPVSGKERYFKIRSALKNV
ncbi:MAG: phosphoribosyltransferase [Metallosphaera yellowstonensis]|jgi:hypoxanthine phosphoribosyltransferase|uniref:Putative phosphoribosyltransferase n=1 Tax=Metallosphaera yellowstonensis MK1 TaxID=671065 RepID=H2C325_9CREN|nr:phosphoribosyltransferase [Metallosphaera yellowstonensis]EHP70646.1 putative phosphoribosyltransferase [Metallosphaera yellowstonensis MK1]